MRSIIKETDWDIPFETNSHLQNVVSRERCERIKRLSNNRLKNMQLFSELTMITEASKDLQVPPDKIHIFKTPEGKPFIMGFENYHISVSHCDNIIMFASDSSPVGVDIEKPRKDIEKLSKRFFTSAEYEKIMNASSKEDEFLIVWTRKESYVKLIGTGLKTPLDSFNVYDDSCYTYTTQDYVSAMTGKRYICSSVCIKKR